MPIKRYTIKKIPKETLKKCERQKAQEYYPVSFAVKEQKTIYKTRKIMYNKKRSKKNQKKGM